MSPCCCNDSSMLFASDSEQAEVNPKRRRSSGARGTFDFLQQPCKCQRRICWQQFQSEIEAVKSKRAELEGLPPHEKAATFQIQSLQFNFQGF